MGFLPQLLHTHVHTHAHTICKCIRVKPAVSVNLWKNLKPWGTLSRVENQECRVPQAGYPAIPLPPRAAPPLQPPPTPPPPPVPPWLSQARSREEQGSWRGSPTHQLQVVLSLLLPPCTPTFPSHQSLCTSDLSVDEDSGPWHSHGSSLGVTPLPPGAAVRTRESPLPQGPRAKTTKLEEAPRSGEVLMSITKGLGGGDTNSESRLFCHASAAEQEGGGSTLRSLPEPAAGQVLEGPCTQQRGRGDRWRPAGSERTPEVRRDAESGGHISHRKGGWTEETLGGPQTAQEGLPGPAGSRD